MADEGQDGLLSRAAATARCACRPSHAGSQCTASVQIAHQPQPALCSASNSKCVLCRYSLVVDDNTVKAVNIEEVRPSV